MARYKCPDCKGEFNKPQKGYNLMDEKIYRCPWCKRKMEGML